MKSSQEENSTQKEVKEIYEKPTIEIIEMEMENILCASTPGFDGQPW